MASLTIGDAKKTDVDALLALEAASFDSDRLSARSLRHLLGSATAAVRVARTEGAIAGYHLLLFRAGSCVARLYSIAVDPCYRGAGIATALLHDAERIARKRGRFVIRLEVREDNQSAMRLYQRLGYRVFGHYKSYYADDAGAVRYEKSMGRRSGRSKAADEDRSPHAGHVVQLRITRKRAIAAISSAPFPGFSLLHPFDVVPPV